MILTISPQMAWYYEGNPPESEGSSEIRLLSSNLRKGQADARAFVALAENHADVVTVSELTPGLVGRLENVGIKTIFPYAILKPEPGARGVGIWSRFPISSITPTKSGVAITAGRLEVPRVRWSPVIVSLHITSPVTAESGSFQRWRRGISEGKQKMREFAEIAAPAGVIAAGDFNSTPDMYEFRELLSNGYRDALKTTGAGFQPTFPSHRWVPPVITIDHVLTRGVSPSFIKTVQIPGTDHRALLASFDLPAASGR